MQVIGEGWEVLLLGLSRSREKRGPANGSRDTGQNLIEEHGLGLRNQNVKTRKMNGKRRSNAEEEGFMSNCVFSQKNREGERKAENGLRDTETHRLVSLFTILALIS